MLFPVAYASDRQASALGLQPTPPHAVAAVLPAVALSHTRSASDPRNDANSFGKATERRKTTTGATSKAAPDATGSAGAREASFGADEGRAAGAASAKSPANDGQPRSSFSISVEQIAAAAQAKSMPFATPLDQVQAGHIVIFVDGGRFLIPVTGGRTLAEAAAAIRASEAPVEVDLQEGDEGVAMSIRARGTETPADSHFGVEYQSSGGPGTPLRFHTGAQPTTDADSVNRLLQDRALKSGARVARAAPVGSHNSRAHKVYGAAASSELAEAKPSVAGKPSEQVRFEAAQAASFNQGELTAKAAAPQATPVRHRAHAAYRQIASAGLA